MRRETSRVSFLMCPFCVRRLLSVITTDADKLETTRPGLRRTDGPPTVATSAAGGAFRDFQLAWTDTRRHTRTR